ncbi:MAG TPA: IS91 family transposase [Thermoanaerobaculia bacterium]|nr:IS91 family transposase [Thermoanaerobaculia bacterium]
MAGSSDLEVAHTLRLYGEAFRQKHRLCRVQLQAMRAIEDCRTAVLGGHLYRCEKCGSEKNVYNSCRNRHCPKCQNLEKERWLEKRRNELLPVPYFHVVFTLPEELNVLALGNPEVIYDLLFASASQTLLEIGADPKHLGARLGALAILHTWGQTLVLHPHLHCIVPGGGPSPDGERWMAASERFLLPVRVLAPVFRGKFLAGLKRLYQEGGLSLTGEAEKLRDPFEFLNFLDRLYQKSWWVYGKPPFGGPEQVLKYLARYTHRVALSNHRLVALADGKVTFTYKDYSQDGRRREMTLPAEEFIRRFLLHILPHRFVRIRYYGLFANRHRERQLQRCRALLDAAPPSPAPESDEREDWESVYQRVTGKDPTLCAECGHGHLRQVRKLPALARRPPP